MTTLTTTVLSQMIESLEEYRKQGMNDPWLLSDGTEVQPIDVLKELLKCRAERDAYKLATQLTGVEHDQCHREAEQGAKRITALEEGLRKITKLPYSHLPTMGMAQRMARIANETLNSKKNAPARRSQFRRN